MNYDDWKLMTPPDYGNNLTFETKTIKTMKSAKARYEEIKAMKDLLPEGCELRLWINDCSKQELLNLGAELGILCSIRSDRDARLYLCIEDDKFEVTFWQ
jgi:hypothetical protein